MSLTKKPQYFPVKITDKMIAQRVALALRHEHVRVGAMLKHIEAVTGIPAKTASKWIEGHYSPKSRHLLTLATYYPEVLRAICEMMGIESVWQHAVQIGLIDAMRSQLNARWKKWKKPATIGDKLVTIHACVDRHLTGQMNHRQLWFLGQLQQGHEMHLQNLLDVWNIHQRTAKRDLAGMMEARVIVARRFGRNCRYELSNRYSS